MKRPRLTIFNALAAVSFALCSTIAVLSVTSIWLFVGAEIRPGPWQIRSDVFKGRWRASVVYDESPFFRKPKFQFIREPRVSNHEEPSDMTLENRWTFAPAMSQYIQSSPIQHVWYSGVIPTPWVRDSRWAGFRFFSNPRGRIPELPGDPPVPIRKVWAIFLPAWFLPFAFLPSHHTRSHSSFSAADIATPKASAQPAATTSAPPPPAAPNAAPSHPPHKPEILGPSLVPSFIAPIGTTPFVPKISLNQHSTLPTLSLPARRRTANRLLQFPSRTLHFPLDLPARASSSRTGHIIGLAANLLHAARRDIFSSHEILL